MQRTAPDVSRLCRTTPGERQTPPARRQTPHHAAPRNPKFGPLPTPYSSPLRPIDGRADSTPPAFTPHRIRSRKISCSTCEAKPLTALLSHSTLMIAPACQPRSSSSLLVPIPATPHRKPSRPPCHPLHLSISLLQRFLDPPLYLSCHA